MRTFLTLATVSAASLGGAATASAAPVAGSVEALYVLNASGGSFDGRTLTLRGVAPSVSWFADRPQRQSGTETLTDMRRQLFGAGQPSPNAALDITGGGDEVYALRLSRPAYDAKRRTLRYRARVLPSLDRTSLAHLEERRAAARPPRSFAPSALFVDDGEVTTPAPAAPPGTGLTSSMKALPFVNDDQATSAVFAASATRPIVIVVCPPWAGDCTEGSIYAGNVLQAQEKYASSMTFYQYDPQDPVNQRQLLGTGFPVVPQLVVYRGGVLATYRVGVLSFADMDTFLATLPPQYPEGPSNPG